MHKRSQRKPPPGIVARRKYHGTVKENLIERLKTGSSAAFEGSDFLFAFLFGSQAKGLARQGSDVDVAVFLEDFDRPELALDATLELTNGLAKASGIGRLDLVVLNVAPLALRGRILKERVVIYSRDEPARVRFESVVMREFFDFDLHARALDRRLLLDISDGRR